MESLSILLFSLKKVRQHIKVCIKLLDLRYLRGKWSLTRVVTLALINISFFIYIYQLKVIIKKAVLFQKKTKQSCKKAHKAIPFLFPSLPPCKPHTRAVTLPQQD